MSDIVERLQDTVGSVKWPVSSEMLKEAATEILRLRAEVRLFEIVVCETAKALGVVPDNDAIIEGIESLRAENEKLRAALVETLDYIDDPYDEFYIEIGQLLESLEAAALKETGDEA